MLDEELRLEFISENATRDKALRDSLIGKRNVDYAKSEAWPDDKDSGLHRCVALSGQPQKWKGS